jgi:hypothetical protein
VSEPRLDDSRIVAGFDCQAGGDVTDALVLVPSRTRISRSTAAVARVALVWTRWQSEPPVFACVFSAPLIGASSSLLASRVPG